MGFNCQNRETADDRVKLVCVSKGCSNGTSRMGIGAWLARVQ
jgi:hypothetical protein